MAQVLVIEDDAAINDVVTTRLSRDGHVVTQAFSGSEARMLLEGPSLMRMLYMKRFQKASLVHLQWMYGRRNLSHLKIDYSPSIILSVRLI